MLRSFSWSACKHQKDNIMFIHYETVMMVMTTRGTMPYCGLWTISGPSMTLKEELYKTDSFSYPD
jgi:hypothetical protein